MAASWRWGHHPRQEQVALRCDDGGGGGGGGGDDGGGGGGGGNDGGGGQVDSRAMVVVVTPRPPTGDPLTHSSTSSCQRQLGLKNLPFYWIEEYLKILCL